MCELWTIWNEVLDLIEAVLCSKLNFLLYWYIGCANCLLRALLITVNYPGWVIIFVRKQITSSYDELLSFWFCKLHDRNYHLYLNFIRVCSCSNCFHVNRGQLISNTKLEHTRTLSTKRCLQGGVFQHTIVDKEHQSCTVIMLHRLYLFFCLRQIFSTGQQLLKYISSIHA